GYAAVHDGHCLRQHGPQPILAESEVVTREVVGEYLGLEQESALFASFRWRYAHVFPALRQLHRTTFVRQAANLWRLARQTLRPGPRGSPLGPHPLRVPLDCLSGAGELVGRTYHEDLAARDGGGSMAGRHVVGTPRLENLLVILVPNRLLALEHVA